MSSSATDGEAEVWLRIWTWPLCAADAALAECQSLLSDDERRRFEAFRVPGVASRFLVARAGLRQHLSAWLGVPANAIRLATTPLGKPWLPDFPEVHFNLSHSGDLAMLARSNVVVGVDVEAIPEAGKISPTVAARMLTADEAARWRALEAQAQSLLFADYWVCKEAMMKACGLGFQLPPAHIAVDLSNWTIELTPTWASQIGQAWQLCPVSVASGYRAAAVVASTRPARLLM